MNPFPLVVVSQMMAGSRLLIVLSGTTLPGRVVQVGWVASGVLSRIVEPSQSAILRLLVTPQVRAALEASVASGVLSRIVEPLRSLAAQSAGMLLAQAVVGILGD